MEQPTAPGAAEGKRHVAIQLVKTINILDAHQNPTEVMGTISSPSTNRLFLIAVNHFIVSASILIITMATVVKPPFLPNILIAAIKSCSPHSSPLIKPQPVSIDHA